MVVDGPDAGACTFVVHLDGDWRTEHVEVSAFGPGGAVSLVLHADAERRWHRDGEPAPDLEGCVDVDVSATVLTNTFAIRRLADLPVGGSATTPVAWVEVPGLRVHRVEQTYRRLDERRWEYSDPTYGAFEIEVDDDGLVVEYAGLATRVPMTS